ncbi:MAG: hypothetical protein SNJ75_05725 [Gemmataceae bacterium]
MQPVKFAAFALGSLVLSLSIAFADQTPTTAPKPTTTPKSSWIAPSLPATTKDQERAWDEIIDRFILADTGKLRGAEAKAAQEAFEQLGEAAIPALLRGLNKAAEINHSCPVLMITKKLQPLLLKSQDPVLLEFARDELQGKAQRSVHATTLENLRVQLLLRRNALERLPLPPAWLAKIDSTGLNQLSMAERGERRKVVLNELAKREDREAMLGLARLAAINDRAIQPLARKGLDQQVARQSLSGLRELLSDANPEIRKAAIRVAGKNRDLIRYVIERVADDRADVRSEARQVLQHFSQGKVDFGPAPGANKIAQQKALKDWQAWWDNQTMHD